MGTGDPYPHALTLRNFRHGLRRRALTNYVTAARGLSSGACIDHLRSNLCA